MHEAGSLDRWVATTVAAALALLVANGASAWVITEQETLRATARAGAAIVYPPAAPARRPGVFVLHEMEGPCPASGGADTGAVACRAIQPATGAPRGRITVDLDREIRVTGLVAAELARAMDAIDPRKGDRLAALEATTILSSIPFQPPDTGGTEWTGVAFGIAGPIALQGSAPAPSDPWKLFKKLAKSMLLPAVAIVVTIALLWVGLRRSRLAQVT
jgi:hypothetical protein